MGSDFQKNFSNIFTTRLVTEVLKIFYPWDEYPGIENFKFSKVRNFEKSRNSKTVPVQRILHNLLEEAGKSKPLYFSYEK